MSRATNKAKREASMNLLPRGPAYKAVRERMPYGEEKESCGRGEQRGERGGGGNGQDRRPGEGEEPLAEAAQGDSEAGSGIEVGDPEGFVYFIEAEGGKLARGINAVRSAFPGGKK